MWFKKKVRLEAPEGKYPKSGDLVLLSTELCGQKEEASLNELSLISAICLTVIYGSPSVYRVSHSYKISDVRQRRLCTVLFIGHLCITHVPSQRWAHMPCSKVLR